MTGILGSIGDVDPIEYGGGCIFSEPRVEYYYGLESEAPGFNEEDDSSIVKVYQVGLEKDGESFLRHYDWVDWSEIARSIDCDEEEFHAAALNSIQGRAHAVEAAAGYWGWDNFDHAPLHLTLKDLKERWNVD